MQTSASQTPTTPATSQVKGSEDGSEPRGGTRDLDGSVRGPPTGSVRALGLEGAAAGDEGAMQVGEMCCAALSNAAAQQPIVRGTQQGDHLLERGGSRGLSQSIPDAVQQRGVGCRMPTQGPYHTASFCCAANWYASYVSVPSLFPHCEFFPLLGPISLTGQCMSVRNEALLLLADVMVVCRACLMTLSCRF